MRKQDAVAEDFMDRLKLSKCQVFLEQERYCYWTRRINILNWLIVVLFLVSFYAGVVVTANDRPDLLQEGMLPVTLKNNYATPAIFLETTTAAAAELHSLEGFDYSQEALRTKYTLPDPQIYYNQSAVAVVLSGRENFNARQAIRETWGNGMSIYFVIGGPNADAPNPHQSRLEQEQRMHHDILDCIHPDSYKSLPYKVWYTYRWVTENLPETQWIIKVDDDMVVNLPAIMDQFLVHFNSNVPTVVGCIRYKDTVHRDGKWAEPKYKNDLYPLFPPGNCGYAISRPVAKYIADQDDRHYYQGEDTSLGIWLDESNMRVTWVRTPYFTSLGGCLERPWLVLGHYITPELIRECYAQKDQWLIRNWRLNTVEAHASFWYR